MKYLFFRVDSSYALASGHLVRCYRLAKIFSKRYQIIFITNKFNGNFNFIIKDFRKIYLNDKSSNSINTNKDSKKVIEIIKKFTGEKIILVDHYDLDFKWHKDVSKYVNKLICINDYLKKNYCDYLINETYFPNKISQKCLKKNTKIFCGPKYAMIDCVKTKKFKANGIFIFFGSVDEKNVTLRLIKILKEITNKKIFIIIGKRNKNKNKILAIKKKNFLFIDKYTNLNLYLRKCNTAIVAGGSIVWETLYNKLNTIVIPTARNQYSNIKNLEKDKIIQTLYLNKLNENALKSIIFQKKNNFFKNIVDGNGIKRIYKGVIK